MKPGILAASIGLIIAGSASADDWPTWRGPNRDGVSAEKGLPTKWSKDNNILWKVKLPGPAGSTPVIWGDRIFLTSPDPDRKRVLLICIGIDGKKQWEATVSSSVRKSKNIASASPTTDGKHVWTYCGTGDLVCFTVAGKEVWRVNLQQRYGRFKLSFGMTTTPVVHDGTVYLQLIHSGGANVVAFDASTGKERWKAGRTSEGVAECEHSYASIQIWTASESPVLVSHGNDYTVGHRVKDGKEIWRIGNLNPKDKYNRTLRFVSSPLVTKDLIVIPTAKNGQVVGLVPDGETAKEVWRLPKGTPDVSCPLLYRGNIYMSHKKGGVTCLDASTGKVLYLETPKRESIFASPVAADGKIYITGRRGTVSVLEAGRTFKVLAVNRLDDALDASPAISNGRIYLRGTFNLWAIGSK